MPADIILTRGAGIELPKLKKFRKAMEDIKNMEFELITNENLSTPEIIDGKFNRVVTISDEHDNLKL